MSWLAYWLGELQRLSLLSLFTAALAVVAVYLVQYGLRTLRQGGGKTPPPPPRPPAPELLRRDEDSLFAWLLSLNSWKSEWQKAWIAALNEEAKLRADSWLFTFEEDEAPQPLELVVQRVISVVKSAEEKVVSCNVIGNAFHFIVNVSRTSSDSADCQSYNVKLTPLHLQLELSIKSSEEDIQVKWSYIYTSETNIEVKSTKVQENQTAGAHAAPEAFKDVLQSLINSASPCVSLCTKPTDIKAIQSIQTIGALSQGTSPPKPPRAHELKLLMKNIRATLTNQSTTGSIKPICIIQLNDPLQKFSSSVANNPLDLSWKDEFIFELNARSKDLQIKIVENGELEGGVSALATVPLDLFRKQPSGHRSFALSSQLNSSSSSTIGSVLAEFSYIEPSESRSLQAPTKFPVAKIEKDRTVMPCGTVVTTVTAVKAKPLIEGRSSALYSDSPVQSPAKLKVIEKDLSVQAIYCRKASVSKALSSSDTELLVLNGTDPVAEVAIRQLSESAKQKLKSPRKKSTIIISGVSKTHLPQDSEAALMMDYAAAMDGSCKQDDTSGTEVTLTQSPSDEELSLLPSQTISAHEDPQENSHGAWTLDSSQQWHSNALLDQDCDKTSGSSISISEPGTVKKSKGGIFKKSAKLFFLRRHHQKDPGMSQSHNDLIYLQQPPSNGTRKKGGTLTRILNKKIHFKSKSKLNGPSVEPYA
ncbi:C2 domain-containing protein 2 isoform X2 [Varanus komodoensis]|uniref:C2 domain-containing protein 2 isoform X2 n=1 Tax=Varanus komodoensis TaxID=61221 RepID=UPI001CF76E49|nr:C2 domain-containing protein 2 isoform X2 [Varanus komodoensis]